jgi:uncharacterized protein (DUF58 family)
VPPGVRVVSLFLIPPTLFLVGVCLFIALLARQWELTVLCLLVLTVAAGAKLWAALSLSGITCRAAVDRRRAFPGEPLVLTVEAENRRCLPVMLRVDLPVGGLRGPAAAPRAETGLLWYQRVAFRWELSAAQRGVHLVGPLRVTAGDLLGFFASRRTEIQGLEVLVYPRIRCLQPFPIPRAEFFGVAGAESPVRDPVYILGTRDYQPGRPARHIHWKASARHARLQEKLFEPSEQEKALLLLAVDRFVQEDAREEFEQTLEAMASLAARLDRDGCAVGLIVDARAVGGVAPVVPVGRSAEQLPAILERLARLTMESAGPLAAILERLPVPWGTSCLAFALDPAGGVLAARDTLVDRRLAVSTVVARPGAADAGGPADTRALQELFLPGAAA